MSWYRYKDGAMVPVEDPGEASGEEFNDTLDRLGYMPHHTFGEEFSFSVEFYTHSNPDEFFLCFNTFSHWYPVFVTGWFAVFEIVAKMAPLLSLTQMSMLHETFVETRDTLNPGIKRWRAKTS